MKTTITAVKAEVVVVDISGTKAVLADSTLEIVVAMGVEGVASSVVETEEVELIEVVVVVIGETTQTSTTIAMDHPVVAAKVFIMLCYETYGITEHYNSRISLSLNKNLIMFNQTQTQPAQTVQGSNLSNTSLFSLFIRDDLLMELNLADGLL